MSNLDSRGVKTADTDDDTNSLYGQAMTDIKNADCGPYTYVTSEAVALQIRAVTTRLWKLLEFFHDLMKDLGQSSFRRNDETSGLTQGSSRKPNTGSDTW